MKQIFYTLTNKSGSCGQYQLDGDEYFLNVGESVTLKQKPTNYTENINVSFYKRDIPENKILHKKPITVKNDDSSQGED